jgi:hypothetical protein
VLTGGTKVVLETPGVTGRVPPTTSSSIEEVGKVLGVFKELIGVEEAEQLVSVTVVLSVIVTIDTAWGFSRVEVELVIDVVLWAVLEPVGMSKETMEPPGTGGVTALMPGVELKRPAITLLQWRGRSANSAGW